MAVGLLVGGVFIAVKLPAASTSLTDPPRGDLSVDAQARGQWRVGDFSVTLGAALTVTHPEAAVPVWETASGDAFLSAAEGDAAFIDDLGLLRVHDAPAYAWADQTVSAARLDRDVLVLAGTLGDDLGWEMRLREGDVGRLDVDVSVDDAANRIFLSAALDADEGVHGFGAQTAAWDLRGQRIPLIPREQGIGRGEQPLSFLVDLAASAAGGQDTTYLVSGVNVTDHGRSMAYTGTGIAVVDLRPDDRMIWEVWSAEASFSVAAADTPLAALEIQSEGVGAADAPPAWVSDGLIAGLQGGTDEVRERLATLQQADIPVTAVWLQDWVGRRTTSFGDRLQWNWVLDREQYPGWEGLVSDLADDGIRVLTYVNAFLSEDSGAASAARGDRDLYAEAAELGYLALDEHGDVLDADQHGFTAASVDLSNPDAREWFAQVIADEVAGVGATGWMADFAEGPPPEAQLFGGSGIEWRVRWPVLWQEVNRRALEIAGLQDDGLVWHRSGGTASAGTADALWMGDQTQDWSREDGLASTITMTQSLAATGMAQVHGDIGGYTSIAVPIIGDVARDDELLLRWAEASLLQPVFRTHEGNRPDASAQPAEDPELAARLAPLLRAFVALGPERERLVAEDPLGASAQHPSMLEPDDPLLADADGELRLGPDVLLAPVVSAGKDAVDVVLPAGEWRLVWTGETFGEAGSSTTVTVPAPLGQPALLVRVGTQVDDELAALRR
ncbi:alpha-glucosidase [Microbacterium pseudoresistens]